MAVLRQQQRRGKFASLPQGEGRCTPSAAAFSIEAFDVETTADLGLGPRPFGGDRIFAWQRCGMDGEAKLRRIDPNRKSAELQAYINDTSIHKACHNLKFELSMLKGCGYHVPENAVWHDTMIMSQLVNNLRAFHKLDYVAWELDPSWDRSMDFEINRLAHAYGGYHRVPNSEMWKYQEYDVLRTLVLFAAFYPDIESDSLLLEDYRNEIELIKVTRDVEERGIMLHEGEAKKLLGWLEGEIERASADAKDFVGQEINLGSPDQVSWLLFEKLKLPVHRLTPTGKPTTNKDVLAELEMETGHEIFKVIRRHRSYLKGHGIVSGYLRLAGEDMILRTDLQTNGARTGREISRQPDLQNVSKDRVTEKVPFPVPARNCFCPRPEHAFFILDESGIEIRLIANSSQCRGLLDCLGRGDHPHEMWCQYMYGDRFTSRADKELYDPGKNGHFAAWYGGGPTKVASTVGLPLGEYKRGLAAYARICPEILTYASSGTERVRREGHIKTPFGRELRIPKEELFAWFNYDIQGTAAGIIKRAQVECARRIRKNWAGGVHEILTVHDDILFEVHRHALKYLPDIYKELNEAMTNIPHIDVPLATEAKLGLRTWGTAQEYNYAHP